MVTCDEQSIDRDISKEKTCLRCYKNKVVTKIIKLWNIRDEKDASYTTYKD